jgi:hypothetical protein
MFDTKECFYADGSIVFSMMGGAAKALKEYSPLVSLYFTECYWNDFSVPGLLIKPPFSKAAGPRDLPSAD